MLKKLAHIPSHHIRDVEPFRPAQEDPGADCGLVNRIGKGKSEAEDWLMLGRREAVSMEGSQKRLNLPCDERKEVCSTLGDHEVARDRHFGLRGTERSITMEVHRTDTQVSPTEIDSQREALRSQVRCLPSKTVDTTYIIPTFSLPPATRVT